MSELSAFRVTVRGTFDRLGETERAALAARSSGLTGAPMFSETGTFTHDRGMTVFTFRCQVPAGPDDDERAAVTRATAALRAHGLPCRDLSFAVTDMRAIRIRRPRRGRSGP